MTLSEPKKIGGGTFNVQSLRRLRTRHEKRWMVSKGHKCQLVFVIEKRLVEKLMSDRLGVVL